MKRLQIYIEEELDDRLGLEARRSHTSKAALIRRYVADRLPSVPPEPDPLDDIVGISDAPSGPIDDVVYPRR